MHALSSARNSTRVDWPLPGLYIGTRTSAERLLWPQQTYEGASPEGGVDTVPDTPAAPNEATPPPPPPPQLATTTGATAHRKRIDLADDMPDLSRAPWSVVVIVGHWPGCANKKTASRFHL